MRLMLCGGGLGEKNGHIFTDNSSKHNRFRSCYVPGIIYIWRDLQHEVMLVSLKKCVCVCACVCFSTYNPGNSS